MSIKYFPVIQDSSKAVFRRSLKYVNKLAWTDAGGVFHPAVCKGIEPTSLGMYIVDTESEWGKEQLAVMRSFLADKNLPILGEFDSLQEAQIAERKERPLTDKEKVLRAEQIIRDDERKQKQKVETQRKE